MKRTILPNKSSVGLGNVDNTSDVNKPVPLVLHGLTAGAETIPRWVATTSTSTTMSTGVLRAAYFTAPRSESVTSIVVCSGTTVAGATPTLVKFGLYSAASDGSLTLLQATTNDTAIFAGASTAYPKSITSTALTAGSRYAIAVLVVTAATAPTVVSSLSSLPGAELATAPRIAATITGQTDLQSSYAAGSLVNTGHIVYATVR